MRKIVVLLSFLLIFSHFPRIASAHETVNNGGVSLLIHIDPDDVAAAGQATIVHVDLEDTEKSFALEKCTCTFYIEQNEKRVFSSALTPSKEPSVYDAEGIPVTFPTDGDFNVGVEGAPISKSLFASFVAEVPVKILPAGTDLSLYKTISGVHPAHQHGSPRLVLAEVVFITLVMGYFLFGNKIPMVKVTPQEIAIREKRALSSKRN